MAPSVLVFSNDAKLQKELSSKLSGRFELVVAESLEAARSQLRHQPVQAAVAHLCPEMLNGFSANEFFDQFKTATNETPVYALVDKACPTEVQESAAGFARECLPMPVDFDCLGAMIDDCRSLEGALSACGVDMPHRSLEGTTRSLLTFTPVMFEMFDELRVAAAHDVTVLLIGETGSGKTYLARLIHELSERRDQRCLTVGCGALPPDLIESELFGYVKGAFTGADTDKEGKFAAAASGTLLLDEIDVLAPKQQAKLLRVIEAGEYEPVGSNDTQTSSARLVVASNHDLEELVQANKFRMDLYYRLNMLCFRLPPLRQRPLDIEYLTRRFALNHSRTHKIKLSHIEPEFLAALRQYRWPGNIRELENVIRRAVLYCRDGVLSTNDLPSAMRPKSNGVSVRTGSYHQPHTLEERVNEVEHRIIEESLRRNEDHRTDTARELGISRVTLYNKMKKFGMLN